MVLFALVLVGCGGGSESDQSTSQGGSGSSGSEASSSDFLSSMEADIAKAEGPDGTFSESPTTSPVRAGSRKKIALISCGEEIGACRIEGEAAEVAATKLGWETTLFDAKSDYASANTGIRQALAEGVDGISVYFIDCQYIRAGLLEAKEQGVPVVAASSRDCNETGSSSEPLFDESLRYNGGLSIKEQLETYGRLGGEYAIVAADGKSNALAFYDSIPAIKPQEDGLKSAYADCPECQLEVVNFPESAYGTRLQEIGEQSILQNPGINTVLPSFEASALEIFPAVRSSGKEAEILTYLGEGNIGGLELIREGAHGYSVAWPVAWEGWGSMDNLGRLFLGQKPVPTGMGFQVVDAEHNLSDSGPAEAPIDYQAMYEKAWHLN
jgi:ribose transport system substrate-binding protein